MTREEHVDGRLCEVPGHVACGRDETARQGEELVEVDAEDHENREEEDDDGRPEEVAQPDPLLAQEAPEDAQDEERR